MKTILNMTALASVLVTGLSSAEVKWVETKFWKAPQVTSLSIKLEGKETLTKQCSYFRKNLEQISTRADVFVKFRKPLSPISLKLAVNAWEKIEKEVELGDEVAQDKLPYQTQRRAVTGVQIDQAGSFQIVAGEKSFSAIARKLNAPESQFEVVRNSNNQLTLNVYGLDMACDLYEGNAFVSMKAPSYIRLNSQDADQLEDFYNNKLLPQVKDLLDAKKEAIQFRALKLGNRTGKILSEEFPELSEKDSEKMLMDVTNILFNTKTLEASDALEKINDSYYASVERSLEAAPVTIKLEF